MTDRVRFTITVESDVHAAFVELAGVSGQSLSRVVGDWLRDTSDSARFTAVKLREVRMQPAEALRELAAHQMRAVDQTKAFSARLARQGGVLAGAESAAEPRSRHRAALVPPPSNTGGKGTRNNPKGRRS